MQEVKIKVLCIQGTGGDRWKENEGRKTAAKKQWTDNIKVGQDFNVAKMKTKKCKGMFYIARSFGLFK